MALDRDIQGKITSVVTEWVNQSRMFTAFEVSLAVKDLGVRERHRNLRDTVHEIIFKVGGPLDYSRTLMDVGAPEQAWVYHPKAVSPYRYQPLDRTGTAPQRTPAADADLPPLRNPAGLVWGSVAQAGVPAGAYGTDSLARLCLPVMLLHGIGVGPGDRVKVQFDATEKKIIAEKGGEDGAFTAEADGNVRLTQQQLEQAGLSGLQCYRIEGTTRRIVVWAFEE